MNFRFPAGIFSIAIAAVSACGQLPDIRDVEPDLSVPAISENAGPAAGKRVFVTDEKSGVRFVLYLPTDWKPDAKFPVIIELPGNGGFKSKLGDECSGRPEGCKLGYGISGGKGVIWAVLPFLNGEGKAIAITWWGSKPDHKPDTTVALVKRVVAQLCADYGGNSERVFLAGFSRGALACNAIGLADDEIAKLWRGMIPYSHYDGVREGWPYRNAKRTFALERLKRLGKTPQFICHEGSAEKISGTRKYLESTGVTGNFTFRGSGFRNHNDGWTLRPSATRKALRAWFWDLAKPGA